MEYVNFHSINRRDNALIEQKIGVFTRYHADISHLLPFYPIHWHEEMEIVKVQSGKGMFLVEGKEYLVSAGDIVVLRPFVLHSINRIDGNEMTFDAIVFNLRLALNHLAPLLNEKNSVPCVIRPEQSWYSPFEQGLSAILTCDLLKEGEAITTNLYSMFSHIYNNRTANDTSNIAEDKRLYTVRRALEYIRAEYMKEITIENIAKHCGYSEFYLMKLFKQFTGESIVDYTNNYRLTVAGRQLRDTNEEISVIARKVGFNNVSYFNRQFKKLYGITPRQFKNNTIN